MCDDRLERRSSTLDELLGRDQLLSLRFVRSRGDCAISRRVSHWGCAVRCALADLDRQFGPRRWLRCLVLQQRVDSGIEVLANWLMSTRLLLNPGDGLLRDF